MSPDSSNSAAKSAGSAGTRLCGTLFMATRAVMVVIDPESGKILDANPAACQFYGWSLAQLLQKNVFQINTLAPERVADEMQLAAREQRNYFRFNHRIASGEVRAVEVYASSVPLNGHPVLISIVHDNGLTAENRRALQMANFTIQTAELGVLWLSRDGAILFANSALADMSGLTVKELLGRNISLLDASITQRTWDKVWQRVALTGYDIFRAKWRVAARVWHLEIQIYRVHFDGDECLIAFVRNIASMHRLDRLLTMQYDVLEAVAGGMSLHDTLELITRSVDLLAPELISSILLVDEHGFLHHGAAPGLPEPFSRSLDGLRIGPEAGSCGTAAWRRREVFVSDIATDPLWADYKDLALGYGLRACWSTPVMSSAGKVVATFALYYREPRSEDPFHRRIVSACVHLAAIAIGQRESEARIHSLAFYDPLTRLPNRALLADRLQLALARADRESRTLAVLFLDLDRFKTINDSLGHSVGDEFLKAVSGRMQSLLRECDTLARVGGDEFVIIVNDCDVSGATTVAEKLIEAVCLPVDFGDNRLIAGASIGISRYPDDGRDVDKLLRNADTAMYQAKAAGRQGFSFYRHEMNLAVSERLTMESALRRALAEGQLYAHYQPQVRINTGDLYGVEALARWEHPDWGMVSPARFIPLAEETGLIEILGNWMLDETLAQMQRWEEEGLHVPVVAVNLSPQQFRQSELAEEIAARLQRHGLEPTRLMLEITESVMMHEDQRTLDMLAALDKLGVGLSVDDFGTGYSSLSYLKRFPMDELKLDQSFVRDLGEDPEDRALASAVIRIGQSLRLTVVAEGVENAMQLDFLREQGCDIAQGWFFGRPMRANTLSDWLRDRMHE